MLVPGTNGGAGGITPVAREIVRRVPGMQVWIADRREEALAAWDALAPRAPRELTAILTLTGGGASAFGQYLGSEAALRRLIDVAD